MRDYERVALSGVKRIAADTDPEVVAALERLVELGFAMREGDALALMPAEHLGVHDPTRLELLRAMRNVWMQADDPDGGDEALYGELGYWTHWWNELHERERSGPMRMDLVVADDGTFLAKDWTGALDGRIVDYVLSNRLVTGRAIVPPGPVDDPAADIVGLAAQLGFEVRVLPSSTHYVVYDDRTAVVREDDAADAQRHRLVRRPALVDPFRQLFAIQWSQAMPWRQYAKGTDGILHMLAQGWTDARIAQAMHVSERTVSRRVSEAMQAAGARSRFELGMIYARSPLTGPPAHAD